MRVPDNEWHLLYDLENRIKSESGALVSKSGDLEVSERIWERIKSNEGLYNILLSDLRPYDISTKTENFFLINN